MYNTLFLWLEGPLQSWGERAHWDERDTAPEPTKSGVVGLLGCALGLSRDEALRLLSQQIRVGVRCDRPGRMITDYHTVIGGIMSGEGKLRAGTIVSHRDYLCDATFLVAVQSREEGLIQRLAAAIQAPVWPIFLGRKACIPSRPPYAGLGSYHDLEEALTAHPVTIDRPRDGPPHLRAVLETEVGQGARRRDELLSRTRRTYGPRYVREVLVVPQTGEAG